MGFFDILSGGSPQASYSGLNALSGLQNLTPEQQKYAMIQNAVRGFTDFGSGLAQAGAPNASGRPVSFGQALGDASQYQDQANRQRQEDQLKQLALIAQARPKYEVTKDAFGNPIAYNSLNPSDTKPLGGTGMFGGGGNMPASGGTVGDASNPAGVSGDEFLKTLPPQIGTQVKAIAEGRMAMPGGMAMKTPYWQQMLQAVGQYDPNFDQVNYNGRNQTYKAFQPGGKLGQNVTAIDTAINTGKLLKDASDKLGGWKYGNSVRNFFLDQMSDPDLVRYNNLAKAEADETTKAVVGAGGTGGDRDTRYKTLTANQSPEARNAGLQSTVQELAARLDPVAQSYNQGMGTSKGGIDLLTPSTAEGYNKIMGTTPDNVNASGQKVLQSDSHAPKISQIQPGTKEYNNAILKAKSAIESGKDPAAVRARLQQYGINPQGF